MLPMRRLTMDAYALQACMDAIETAGMQDELACIEDWANGELDFLG